MISKVFFSLPLVLLVTIVFAPAMAQTSSIQDLIPPTQSAPFVDILSSEVWESFSQVSVKTNLNSDPIPKGAGFAHGTGVLTFDPNNLETGLGTLGITVTHAGVWDSVAQSLDNPADPKASAIDHNHYVDLVPASEDCEAFGAVLEVASISHELVGVSMWQGNMEKIWELDKVSSGTTDFITGNPHIYTLGELDVNDPLPPPTALVVSFTLAVPFFADADLGIPGAVCVIVEDLDDAEIQELIKVGGTDIPISATSLLITGVQSSPFSILGILAVLGAGAFGAVYLSSKRKN